MLQSADHDFPVFYWQIEVFTGIKINKSGIGWRRDHSSLVRHCVEVLVIPKRTVIASLDRRKRADFWWYAVLFEGALKLPAPGMVGMPGRFHTHA